MERTADQGQPPEVKTYRGVLEQEGEWITATAPEIDVTTQGHDREDALSMLREAISLRLDIPEEQVRVEEGSPSSSDATTSSAS